MYILPPIKTKKQMNPYRIEKPFNLGLPSIIIPRTSGTIMGPPIRKNKRLV